MSFLQTMGDDCYKGMSSPTYLLVFKLWGTVTTLCDTNTEGGGWVIIQMSYVSYMTDGEGWVIIQVSYVSYMTDDGEWVIIQVSYVSYMTDGGEWVIIEVSYVSGRIYLYTSSV
jgi:hypothetical protein